MSILENPAPKKSEERRPIPLKSGQVKFPTAVSLVIATMIGTGVFTSLGFQAAEIKSIFSLLLLWFVGGIIALCGALAYGELGAALPRSGGEYNYLSVVYHPLVGFLSGWVSVTVGFAAPVAVVAMALGAYLKNIFPQVNALGVATLTVLFFTILHSYDIKLGSIVQNLSTWLKILLIIGFVIAGLLAPAPQSLNVIPSSNDIKEIFSKSAFAVSLVYVSYAYSGWNTSGYIAGELDNPQKNIPRSIISGTIVVMILYVLLNYIFLYTAPLAELSGQVEVGFISASHIFAKQGAKIMALLISLTLLSTISSLIFAGPRIAQVMGEDLHGLRFLAKKNNRGLPMNAILLQSGITFLMLFTSSFEKALTYVGFTLSLFTFLTVLGLFILRKKKPDLPRPYKTWGYPVTPIIFLSLTLWTLVFVLKDKPGPSLAGLGTVLCGVVIYFASKK